MATAPDSQRITKFSRFCKPLQAIHQRFQQDRAPLTAMTKCHSARLISSPESRQAFDELKTRFTFAPMLRHPDPEREFIVEVDASNTGEGAILSQCHSSPAKMYPCAFFSRKLTAMEQNYEVGNRELLAMKLALEEWRHWLEGAAHPFIILTDHKNLKYLSDSTVSVHKGCNEQYRLNNTQLLSFFYF